MRRTLLCAEVVYNGMGTPRRNGAVVVQEAVGEHTVIAVGDREELAESYPDADRAPARFAVSPPPVNAHTHLDLSTMAPTEGSYEEFVRAVISHSRAGKRGLAAAERGVEELLASGVEWVGDIVTDDEVMRFLLQHPRLRGVAYWEVIAPDPAVASEVLRQTAERLAEYRSLERPGGMRVGVSPHSPHTVSSPLLRGLAQLASRQRLPMQIHVAESPAEVEFHRDGSGPLMELMASFLPGWRPSGLSPVAYLDELGVLSAGPSLVHVVHADDTDIARIRRAGCVVIHCARSNTVLGCGRFRWEEFARQGVTVALGTDSRGSSPSLSIEEEVVAAAALHGPKASPLALVRAAVKGGYRALGAGTPRFARGDRADALHLWRTPAGGSGT